MNNPSKFLLFCLLVVVSTSSQAQVVKEEAVRQIQSVIESTYIEVLYKHNENLDLLKEGFHPDFNMYVYYKNELTKSSLEEWMDKLAINREKRAGRPYTGIYSWKFANIEVAGQTGMVRLEVSLNGEPKYTDFLTLYKVADHWMVITKLFTFY